MVRTVIFIVFFTIGILAISVSTLIPDLNQYHDLKLQLAQTEQKNEKLQSLIEETDAMIENLKSDPNASDRLAMVTLGYEPNSPETAFPKPDAKTLLIARKALRAASQEKEPQVVLPEWVTRCSAPNMRWALFAAGAGLIIVSFTCFGPGRKRED